MIAQFLSPLSITCSLQPHNQICKTHLLNSTKRCSFTYKHWNLSSNNNISGVKGLRCSSNSSKDDNGSTVDEMESYLNNLSLEYDSVWDTKPAWYIYIFISCDFILVLAFHFFLDFVLCCIIIWFISAIENAMIFRCLLIAIYVEWNYWFIGGQNKGLVLCYIGDWYRL